jgi:tetratricopeptide (TPR) repeat protein
VTPDEAGRLLDLSRRAQWRFPSSAGSPIRADEDAWVEPLLAEQEPFAAAVRVLAERGDQEAATELAANVWRLWMVSRDLAGGRAFLAPALDRTGEPSRARALALYGDSLFAFWQGDHEGSHRSSEEALEAATAAADAEALALAHLALSRVAFGKNEFERARELAVRAREHARGLGPALGQAPLHAHAQSTRMTGDYDRAGALFEESLALNRRIRDEGMVAVELHNLGHVELHRGNVDAAERCFGELARLGLGDDSYGRVLALLNEAALSLARDGGTVGPANLLAEIDAVLDESATELAPDDQFELDELRAAVGAEDASRAG